MFAHNITISIRGFWSNDETSDCVKVEQMKWTNEIQHRVTSKIRHVRLELNGWGGKVWTEDSFSKMVMSYVRKCPTIAGDIAWCINSSYESVINIES